jgi:hypothetical protein
VSDRERRWTCRDEYYPRYDRIVVDGIDRLNLTGVGGAGEIAVGHFRVRI